MNEHAPITLGKPVADVVDEQAKLVSLTFVLHPMPGDDWCSLFNNGEFPMWLERPTLVHGSSRVQVSRVEQLEHCINALREVVEQANRRLVEEVEPRRHAEAEAAAASEKRTDEFKAAIEHIIDGMFE